MRDPKDILINGIQLSAILENHREWLLDKEGGVPADLRAADLSDADLRAADLRAADLSDADLSAADLRDADLRDANLRAADLRAANLRAADLRAADLRDADLRDANLRAADLRAAEVQDAKNSEFAEALVTIVSEGDIIGWKKLRGGLIAKLLIPSDARRSNATGRKCRAEFAQVLEILDGNKPAIEGTSQHDFQFKYHVGKIVRPHHWGENRWEECAGGIHFFITRIEAEKY